jgi:hypothetical protein
MPVPSLNILYDPPEQYAKRESRQAVIVRCSTTSKSTTDHFAQLSMENPVFILVIGVGMHRTKPHYGCEVSFNGHITLCFIPSSTAVILRLKSAGALPDINWSQGHEQCHVFLEVI